MEQAARHNEGKPQVSYLADIREGLFEVARVFTFGAKKYAPHNWKKGRSYRDTCDSAMRHLMAFADGETRDKESGLHHLAHAAWNCLVIICWSAMGLDEKFDDRDLKDK